MSKPNRADLETLRDLAESGRIRAVVDQAYPLDQTPSVVEQLGAGRSSGKRVVTV
jgi:NADPH:quinone reductase-like Zn-dependent oxidoreductase